MAQLEMNDDPGPEFTRWQTEARLAKRGVAYCAEPSLTTNAVARKNTPIFSGCFRYFPRALAAVAVLSQVGNEQHNPGSPLHWDRSKSGDEWDALARHLLEVGTVDSDGIRHAAKVAWRALAGLEKELEAAAEEP